MTETTDDVEALLEHFFTRYSPILFHLFCRLTQSQQTAELLLIDVFTSAREELASFGRSGESEIGWILCFARSALIKSGFETSDFSSAANLVRLSLLPLEFTKNPALR